MEPLPHQIENGKRLRESLQKYGAALDASATGTGKTLTSVFLAKSLGAKLAVVCPLACISGWQRACAAVGVETVFVTNYEAAKSKKFRFGALDAKRKNYEWKITEPRTLFVFDEVHRCRSRTSINTKMLLGATRKFKTLLLSATPFVDPMEAYAIGIALKLFPQNSYFSWLLRNGVRKNFMGFFEFKGGPEHIEKIHHDIFPEKGVRTRHDDIEGFPDTVVMPEVLNTGAANEITKLYTAALQARVDAEAAEHAEFEMPVPVITQALRERQQIELCKCSAIAERALDARDKGLSVAIFLNFTASIDLMKRLLDTEDIVQGGQNNFARINIVDRFVRNLTPFIIVNNAAGGAGISLHDETGGKRGRVSLISPPLSAVMLKQVLGRPHRHGGGYSQQYLVFAADTIEETRLMPKISAKLNNLDLLVDGDLDVLTLA